MKFVKVTKTEKRILDSIKRARASGKKITDLEWSITWNSDFQHFECEEGKCCPLGAVLVNASEIDLPDHLIDCLDRDPSNSDLMAEAVAHILGKSDGWVNSFISAYDSGCVEDDAPTQGERTGLKIRGLLKK